MTASGDSLKKLETDIRNCARELLDQGFEIDARATADEEFSWADRLAALSASRASVGEDYARGLQVASDLCQSRAEWVTAGELHRMSLAALATPPPQPKDAEVAAWMATHGKYAEAFKSYETLMTFIASDEANSVLGDGEEWTIKPLYAHPAPPASQAVGDKDGEPSPGLLMSMAIRYDHALGVPGYYDNSITGEHMPGQHARRLEATLTTMRQLWEEVSGNGFYRPAKEAEYAAMLNGEQ